MSGPYMSGDNTLDERKLQAIDIGCRSVLHAAWPLAAPGQVEAALDVLRPYMAERAVTGRSADRHQIEEVGQRLREIFDTDAGPASASIGL